MAAPKEKTISDLNGTWVMSKALSDDMGPGLELQGIPWIVRKAVSFATITGQLTQTTNDERVTAISIAQTATGGIKGETETHVLDGKDYPHSSGMFGTQVVKTRWLDAKSDTASQLDEFLLQGWLEEEDSPRHIYVSVAHEKSGWTADQVWGFSDVQGERYFVKRFLVKKGTGVARMRMIYEWRS